MTTQVSLILYVALGGAFGSVLRYLTGLVCTPWITSQLNLWLPKTNLLYFTYATLLVNVIGAFLIGLASALFNKMAMGLPIRLLVITGVLGGFTTFSSFGLDTLQLIQQQQLGLSALYVASSVVLGLTMVYFGWMIGQ